MRSIPLLIIGDLARPEFVSVAQTFDREWDAHRAASVEQAIESFLDPSNPVEVIVCLQSAPGDFSCDDVDRLRNATPLARIVVVFGPWCEGESRNATRSAGTMRIPAHRWTSWWRRQLRQMADEQPPDWLLPATIAPDELWLRRPSRNIFPDPASAATVVGVVSSDRHFVATIEESLRSVGLPSRVIVPNDVPSVTKNADNDRGPDVLLWHVGREQLNGLNDSTLVPAGVPWIALVHFPRPADRERLVALGALDVFAMPFDFDDLLESIFAAGHRA